MANWGNCLNEVMTTLGRAGLPPAGLAVQGSPAVDHLALESQLRRLSAELQNDDAKASRNAAELSRLLADHEQADLARALARHAAQNMTTTQRFRT